MRILENLERKRVEEIEILLIFDFVSSECAKWLEDGGWGEMGFVSPSSIFSKMDPTRIFVLLPFTYDDPVQRWTSSKKNFKSSGLTPGVMPCPRFTIQPCFPPPKPSTMVSTIFVMDSWLP